MKLEVIINLEIMTVTGKKKSAGGERHAESCRPLQRERRSFRKMQSES
jgi:hypothetical protein